MFFFQGDFLIFNAVNISIFLAQNEILIDLKGALWKIYWIFFTCCGISWRKAFDSSMELDLHSSWLEICVHVKVFNMVWSLVWCYLNYCLFAKAVKNSILGGLNWWKSYLCFNNYLDFSKPLLKLKKFSFNVSVTAIWKVRENAERSHQLSTYFDLNKLHKLVHQDVIYISLN